MGTLIRALRLPSHKAWVVTGGAGLIIGVFLLLTSFLDTQFGRQSWHEILLMFVLTAALGGLTGFSWGLMINKNNDSLILGLASLFGSLLIIPLAGNFDGNSWAQAFFVCLQIPTWLGTAFVGYILT